MRNLGGVDILEFISQAMRKCPCERPQCVSGGIESISYSSIGCSRQQLLAHLPGHCSRNEGSLCPAYFNTHVVKPAKLMLLLVLQSFFSTIYTASELKCPIKKQQNLPQITAMQICFCFAVLQLSLLCHSLAVTWQQFKICHIGDSDPCDPTRYTLYTWGTIQQKASDCHAKACFVYILLFFHQRIQNDTIKAGIQPHSSSDRVLFFFFWKRGQQFSLISSSHCRPSFCP